MSDEAILWYVKSIDERTARMEISQDKITESHDKRISSLENSRKIQRAVIGASTLGGSAAGAKVGIVDKILSIWGGS